MKRYFVNGKEISEFEAFLIKKQNEEYLKSDDLTDWLNCKFVAVINDEG